MASLLCVSPNLTAAGNSQSTAYDLSTQYQVHVVTSAASGTGVQLPAYQANTSMSVKNANTSPYPFNVYAQTGGAINGYAANAAYSIPVGATVEFLCTDGLNWSIGPFASSAAQFMKPIINAPASGTLSLTAAQSGSIVNIGATSGALAIDLPAVAAGLDYEFLVSGSLASGVTTITGTTACIKGPAVAMDVTAVVGAGATAKTNVVLGTGSVIGDYVRLRSVDGVSFSTAGTMITTHTTLTVS